MSSSTFLRLYELTSNGEVIPLPSFLHMDISNSKYQRTLFKWLMHILYRATHDTLHARAATHYTHGLLHTTRVCCSRLSARAEGAGDYDGTQVEDEQHIEGDDRVAGDQDVYAHVAVRHVILKDWPRVQPVATRSVVYRALAGHDVAMRLTLFEEVCTPDHSLRETFILFTFT